MALQWYFHGTSTAQKTHKQKLKKLYWCGIFSILLYIASKFSQGRDRGSDYSKYNFKSTTSFYLVYCSKTSGTGLWNQDYAHMEAYKCIFKTIRFFCIFSGIENPLGGLVSYPVSTELLWAAKYWYIEILVFCLLPEIHLILRVLELSAHWGSGSELADMGKRRFRGFRVAGIWEHGNLVSIKFLQHPPPSGINFVTISIIKTRRYSPLRGLTSSSCGGLRPRPRLFLPFGQKKRLLCCFGPFLAIFGVQ